MRFRRALAARSYDVYLETRRRRGEDRKGPNFDVELNEWQLDNNHVIQLHCLRVLHFQEINRMNDNDPNKHHALQIQTYRVAPCRSPFSMIGAQLAMLSSVGIKSSGFDKEKNHRRLVA